MSLEVPVRATTAIVGQTGSGKSTLLRLLCGLEAADAGSLTVCGINAATKRGRRQIRRAVGYVMQHPERQLFAQTVAEDVAFGPRNQGLTAVGLGLPRPLAYAREHALDARPLTLEALVAALRAQDAEEARSHGL